VNQEVKHVLIASLEIAERKVTYTNEKRIVVTERSENKLCSIDPTMWHLQCDVTVAYPIVLPLRFYF